MGREQEAEARDLASAVLIAVKAKERRMEQWWVDTETAMEKLRAGLQASRGEGAAAARWKAVAGSVYGPSACAGSKVRTATVGPALAIEIPAIGLQLLGRRRLQAGLHPGGGLQVSRDLTAAIPVESPDRSCKLTLDGRRWCAL